MSVFIAKRFKNILTLKLKTSKNGNVGSSVSLFPSKIWKYQEHHRFNELHVKLFDRNVGRLLIARELKFTSQRNVRIITNQASFYTKKLAYENLSRN